jgi:hypothetical protein
MSQLTPEQLTHVEQWAADGANLNHVQDRLKTEFGISLTYLDARLLMVDVGVRLQEKPREVEKVVALVPEPPPAENALGDEGFDEPAGESAGISNVTLTSDQVATPGALISGKVTFSDGQEAAWYLDQMGRLGLSGAPQGYQPPKEDIPNFQQQLDLLMQQAGF